MLGVQHVLLHHFCVVARDPHSDLHARAGTTVPATSSPQALISSFYPSGSVSRPIVLGFSFESCQRKWKHLECHLLWGERQLKFFGLFLLGTGLKNSHKSVILKYLQIYTYHIYTHIQMHTLVSTYIYIYAHTYMCIYMHIHTHTCTYPCNRLSLGCQTTPKSWHGNLLLVVTARPWLRLLSC